VIFKNCILDILDLRDWRSYLSRQSFCLHVTLRGWWMCMFGFSFGPCQCHPDQSGMLTCIASLQKVGLEVQQPRWLPDTFLVKVRYWLFGSGDKGLTPHWDPLLPRRGVGVGLITLLYCCWMSTESQLPLGISDAGERDAGVSTTLSWTTSFNFNAAEWWQRLSSLLDLSDTREEKRQCDF
jgi:hypothetical protein